MSALDMFDAYLCEINCDIHIYFQFKVSLHISHPYTISRLF